MDVFIHIPKTAGTFIRSVVEKDRGKGAYLYDEPSHVGLSKMSPEEKLRIQEQPFVCGHQYYSALRGDIDGARFSTVLRNPVDRVISFYNHAHSYFPSFKDRRLSLLAFIEAPSVRIQCCNYQLRFLCRRPVDGELTVRDLEDAIGVVQSGEVAAGVQELMKPTFKALPITTGLRLPTMRINEATAGNFTRESFTEYEIKSVRDANHLDMQLYKAVLDQIRPVE